jgi:cell division protein FtsB
MKSLTWMLIPVFLLLQYEIWLAPGGLMTLWKVRRQLTAETQINQQWQQRNQALAADIQTLKTSNKAIEDHARADLGMIKPGEILYQLPQ